MNSHLLRHYLRWIGSAVALVAVVLVLMFTLLELTPGDPIQSLVGNMPVSEDLRAQLTAQFGLDRPVVEREGASHLPARELPLRRVHSSVVRHGSEQPPHHGLEVGRRAVSREPVRRDSLRSCGAHYCAYILMFVAAAKDIRSASSQSG